MSSKKTLPISEARKKIFEIAEDVQKPNTYYVLTEKGKPKTVMMSADEFESWQETLEVLTDFPTLSQDIETAEKEYAMGLTMPFEEYLAKQGFILAEKSLPYGVSNRNNKKGTKKPR